VSQPELLGSSRAAALAAASLTYAEVGGTQRAGGLPPGYHHVTASRVVGHGRAAFDAAVADLMGWQVQLRAGVRIQASSARVVTGAVVDQVIGLGPVKLVAPCRVVLVVDEPNRQGFAYGSLPGHPEAGEESFMLSLAGPESAEVVFTTSAFSRPATLLTRAGGPIGRLVQRWMTGRYLRALDPAARA
jgi:uncharacterized protein (UPF0548 family)